MSKPIGPIGPVEFTDRVVLKNEKGLPFTLSDYQRKVLNLAFRRGPDGALLYQQIVLSEPKKSGKSFLAALLGIWWGIITPSSEIICCANDREQARSRVFLTMCDLIEKNPALASEAETFSNTIAFNNGTVVTAISSDYKSSSGSRHSLVIADELWGFESESSRRLWEELCPPPTEFSAWQLVVTYAGFSGESDLLESLYKRGMEGKRIDSELECYENNELFMFWSHTPRQPWQTDAYYEQQRKILRPAQFERLHCNRWVMSESRFVEPSLWDQCVAPIREDPTGSLFVGIDASTKHDSTALVCLKFENESDTLKLATYRIWKPSPGVEMDFEATIEFFLRRLQNSGTILERVLCDPWQMHRTMGILADAGIYVEPYPQTLPNLTLLAESLYSRLANRRLKVYQSAHDLRQHILNCASIETSRGLRLSKEKQSLKIDGAIALGMAIVAAEKHGYMAPVKNDFDDKSETLSRFDARFDNIPAWK